MTQSTKAAWISGVFLITPFVLFILCAVYGSKEITVGHHHVRVAGLSFVITLFVLELISIVAGIAFVVQGFRVHWGWGLANLLVPFAMFVFCFVHPRAAKVPLIITGIGVVWLVAFFLVVPFVVKS
jgi:hypothetical protein